MITADDVDQLAERILRICAHEDVSLFVGAGISLEPPASLPSANDLKWRIFEELVGQPPRDQDRVLLQEYFDAHMLELLVQDLKESIGSGAVNVLDVFRGSKPNLYHRLIARLAHRKLIQRVITTNFDTLVERALADEGVEYTALTTEHDFAECIVRPEDFKSFNVIKLHGTIAFMEGASEIPGRRNVKAISPVKLESRKAAREMERHGIPTFEVGFDRTVSAKETLIGSLDRLGISLSEITTELLKKHLQGSTLIIIGWNGFDLDISPLILDHATNVHWIVHTAETESANRRSKRDQELDTMRRKLRSHGLNETCADMALLVTTPDYPLDVMPTPEKERAQLLNRLPECTETRIFTPLLIRRLWSILTSADSRVHERAEVDPPAKSEGMRLTISRWNESIDPVLPIRWGLGKFFLSHGEYESTKAYLQEVIDGVSSAELHEVTAMVQLDLGELNAIDGRRAEAERAYFEAIRICRQEIEPRGERSAIIDHFRSVDVVERAYFGLGELACEFYDFAAAERAFRQMPIERKTVQALVHYCREEFEEANRLLSTEIRFRRRSNNRFHHYLLYFLKLLDARIHLMQQNLDLAATEFEDVLTVTTKLGLPRLQVQALNGLALTYSDHLKAAKFAVQSMAIANQAEYRYGRAHAGLYMGTIYAAAGLGEVATSAVEFAERLFGKLEHAVGLDFCRVAKARWRLTWESDASSQALQLHVGRARSRREKKRSARGAASPPSCQDAEVLPSAQSSTCGETSREFRIDVCWLDFWGGSPSLLDGLLANVGFRKTEQTGGLEVYRSDDFPDLVLEVVNVDSFPKAPVSKLPGVTPQQIDDDRRRCCAPRGMDPYYRCSIYADTADLTGRADDLYEQMSPAKLLLTSCFIEITSFPGAQVQGDWAVWEKTTLSIGPGE